VLFVSGMAAIPNIGMASRDKTLAIQARYDARSSYLKQIQEKEGHEEEASEVKGELALLKLRLDNSKEVDEKFTKINKDFQLNTGTIAYLCFELFIIYYLTRKYVKIQFQ
jgi:hypothetical protein